MQFHLELTADEATRWADAYADELAAFGKSRVQVVEECRVREERMRTLAGTLMANWIEKPVRGVVGSQ